jgi:hypothetical protein
MLQYKIFKVSWTTHFLGPCHSRKFMLEGKFTPIIQVNFDIKFIC